MKVKMLLTSPKPGTVLVVEEGALRGISSHSFPRLVLLEQYSGHNGNYVLTARCLVFDKTIEDSQTIWWVAMEGNAADSWA